MSGSGPGSRGPIGAFDSGVGGLTVLREIGRLLPRESLLYVADTRYAPYGERSPEYVAERSQAITDFLVAEGAKAVVVACNTATALVVTALRARLAIPVVAIEPAVKPAALSSRTGVIGVLATHRTLESARFLKLVDDHAAGTRVLSEPCPDLVEYVERGEIQGAAAAVACHVHALTGQGADTIVLGCTHFEFLRPAIESTAGPSVRVVDAAGAVAAELRRRLADAKCLAAAGARAPDRIVTSGDPRRLRAVLVGLWPGMIEVEALPDRYCLAPQA